MTAPRKSRDYRERDGRGRFLPARVTLPDSLHAAGLGTLDQPPTFAATLRDLVARQMGGGR